MSLRMVEVTVASDAFDELSEALAGEEVVDLWTVEQGPDRAVVRVLLPSEKTEAVTDLLADRFEADDRFRIVLLSVEATVPAGDGSEGEGQPKRVSREELYEDLSGGSRITGVYLATVALSSVVAAVGLMRGDVAVIVGAMVIAPLLAPNVALSLSATLGDPALAKRAVLASVAGASTALAVAVAIGAAVSFDPTTPELFARSRVGPGDAALALAAGSAGALAYTSGLPTAVIGVMVAVALLPPLVAAGLYLGSGYLTLAAGAAILTVTNTTAINLAGVVTFLVQRVRPRTWWKEEQAKKATRVALVVWILLFAILLALMIWVVGDPEPGAFVT